MANSPILIDSSIWIRGFRLGGPEDVRLNLKILVETDCARITEMVRLEVVAGARSFNELEEILSELEEIPCLETTKEQWRKAERLSFVLSQARRRVAAADTLIAAIAILHKVPLWHADSDFERIKSAVGSDLRTYWYPKHSPPI